jgi:hypothetical protein
MNLTLQARSPKFYSIMTFVYSLLYIETYIPEFFGGRGECITVSIFRVVKEYWGCGISTPMRF